MTGQRPETGTSVVEPLIDTLYERGGRSSTALEYAIEVLENIGTIYATKDTAQAKLAAAYSKLLKGNYGAQEILSSLHELGWWKRSAELQQLFQVFHSLVSGQRLDEFTVEQNDLVRLSQTVRWLGRSRLREWLRESSQILGDVQWYRTSAIEKNRQDALLRMGIRVRRLRQLTAGIADPELTILRQIVEHWQQLIAEATARTGTRADLELELLVDQLRLAKPQPHVVLAKLANTGNAPATNVTAALLPAREGEFRIIEGTKEYPHEIEAGGHRTLEFALEPLRSGSVELSFEVRYDDINRAGHSKLVSGGRVHFLSEVPTYKPIPYDANPYITGAPVRTRNMFYGREDILDWVRSNLSGTYQQNILVLHGQRRTGKTSVLHQLRLSPPTEHHIFVLFDMELAAPKTTGDFFLELAERVHAELTGAGIAMAPPHKDEYESYPERQFRSFCSQLEALLHDRYVVIMIDEFDKLIGKVNEGLLDKDIYDTLRGLMQSSVKVNFLFTGAHEVTKMLGDPTSRLFRMTKPKRIGLLNLNEAEELIRKPVRGLIDYHSLAVSKILRVTAGHPYLIQYICHSLVNLARRKERNYIDLIDVNEVLATKLEEIVVNISTDYEELSEAERRVLAALAYAGDE